MPVIRQAAKKLRRDHRRSVINARVHSVVDRAVTLARKKPTAKSISEAFRQLDKAAKRHLIHPNAVSRTKSRLSKLLKK